MNYQPVRQFGQQPIDQFGRPVMQNIPQQYNQVNQQMLPQQYNQINQPNMYNPYNNMQRPMYNQPMGQRPAPTMYGMTGEPQVQQPQARVQQPAPIQQPRYTPVSQPRPQYVEKLETPKHITFDEHEFVRFTASLPAGYETIKALEHRINKLKLIIARRDKTTKGELQAVNKSMSGEYVIDSENIIVEPLRYISTKDMHILITELKNIAKIPNHKFAAFKLRMKSLDVDHEQIWNYIAYKFDEYFKMGAYKVPELQQQLPYDDTAHIDAEEMMELLANETVVDGKVYQITTDEIYTRIKLIGEYVINDMCKILSVESKDGVASVGIKEHNIITNLTDPVEILDISEGKSKNVKNPMLFGIISNMVGTYKRFRLTLTQENIGEVSLTAMLTNDELIFM